MLPFSADLASEDKRECEQMAILSEHRTQAEQESVKEKV